MHSSVINSTFHNGYSWGMYIKSSANIHIENNVFFRFRPIGVGVLSSTNVTIDNNIVAGIVDRSTVEGDPKMVDKGGAFSICAYFEKDVCSDIRVRNNIAAGAIYGGFVTYGHKCGEYGTMSGNVAHSIKGLKAGHGLVMKQHPNEKVCAEYSDFAGYKCYYNGAFAYPEEVNVRLTRITAVDNIMGFGALVLKKAREYEVMDDVVFSDINVYAETDSPDCP